MNKYYLVQDGAAATYVQEYGQIEALRHLGVDMFSALERGEAVHDRGAIWVDMVAAAMKVQTETR